MHQEAPALADHRDSVTAEIAEVADRLVAAEPEGAEAVAEAADVLVPGARFANSV